MIYTGYVSPACTQTRSNHLVENITAYLHLFMSMSVSQAPAPVAFPMTTPQVPVYGMVGVTSIFQH